MCRLMFRDSNTTTSRVGALRGGGVSPSFLGGGDSNPLLFRLSSPTRKGLLRGLGIIKIVHLKFLNHDLNLWDGVDARAAFNNVSGTSTKCPNFMETLIDQWNMQFPIRARDHKVPGKAPVTFILTQTLTNRPFCRRRVW